MILEANKIHKSYGNKFNKQQALKGMDTQIEKSEFVTIMGPSGAGKTTLLNVLSTIDRGRQGAIKMEGNEVTTMKEKQLAEFRKEHFGISDEEDNMLETLTVKENVLLPLSIKKVSKKEAATTFKTVATELGIYDVKDKYPNEISGGQK